MSEACEQAAGADAGFADWVDTNVAQHKRPGYAIATISLKPIGGVPGDASAEQMDASPIMDELFASTKSASATSRTWCCRMCASATCPRSCARWQGWAWRRANAGLITDIIACPGLDYCDLANARSIPVAQEIAKRFADLDRQHDIGELKIKISGCINACGHHHAGHIGILGVDKKGVEFYQLSSAARATRRRIGDIIGKGFSSGRSSS